MSALLLRIKPACQVIRLLPTPYMLLEFLAKNSHIGRFHINQTLVRSVSLLLLQHICSCSRSTPTIQMTAENNPNLLVNIAVKTRNNSSSTMR